MSIPFLIYILLGILMMAQFYLFRTSATYVRFATIALTNAVFGVIGLLVEIFVTQEVNLFSFFLVCFASLVPVIFHTYAVVFNFNRNVFASAAEDSAQKLLIEVPVWTQDKTVIKSKNAILNLSLNTPLSSIAFIRYTYDGSTSKKLELYKQLLAKHFYSAFPRIKIKAK